jgi:L-alanine-DL-glutamate epimerase-like enolase superfamily enzyme
LHDLLARILDVPLCTLFGGAVRRSFPVLRILAIKTPDEMAANAGRLAEQGISYLKIKIHGDADEDVARVRAIRNAVGDKIHLTVDANQSYAAKDAVAAINRMASFGIDLVEQPVPAGDQAGLAMVSRMTETLIEADEAAASLDDIYRLVSRQLCGAVSLKIPKLGGLRNTLAAARLCEAGGMRYRFGAAVGSRLLTAHALHLASTLPGISYACEFGEFDRLLNDPFEGLETKGGTIDLPNGAGTGVRPVQSLQQAGAA